MPPVGLMMTATLIDGHGKKGVFDPTQGLCVSSSKETLSKTLYTRFKSSLACQQDVYRSCLKKIQAPNKIEILSAIHI